MPRSRPRKPLCPLRTLPIPLSPAGRVANPTARLRVHYRGTYFPNIAEAAKISAAAGGVVKIIKDYTLTTADSTAVDPAFASWATATIDGQGHTITFAAGGRITTSGYTKFQNITLSGGSTATGTARSNSGILVSSGTTTVTNTTIKNFYNSTGSSSAGGAFYVASGATLNLGAGTSASYCLATAANAGDGNSATTGGSVAFVDGGGTVNVTDGTYSNNGTSSDQGSYRVAAFAVRGTSTSTLTISGGTFSNNLGSHGGVVNMNGTSATVTISGGTFTGNSVYWDGGVVFGEGTGTVNISGGTFTGNKAARVGSVVSLRGGTINLSGGSMTGNITTKTWVDNRGAIATLSGNNPAPTINISGNPVVKNNTYGTGTSAEKADIGVDNAAQIKVGTLTGSAGDIGICSSKIDGLAASDFSSDGKQFATLNTAVSTSSTTALPASAFFNDNTSARLVAATAGTASVPSTVVKWQAVPIAKIVTNGVATPYYTLASAISAANAASTDTTIEMLVENYTETAQETVTQASGKTITITTAKGDATDGYRYTGTSGTYATIQRGAAYGSMFALTKGNLTFANMTVDGNKALYTASQNGGIANVSGSGSALALASGATFKNSKSGNYGGGVYLGAGSRMTMASGSLAQNARRQACMLDSFSRVQVRRSRQRAALSPTARPPETAARVVLSCRIPQVPISPPRWAAISSERAARHW